MTEQQKIDICLNCQKPQKACARCADWTSGKSFRGHETRKAIKELHSRGLVDREIAEKLGKTQPVICKTRNRMGLPPNGNPYKRIDYERVRAMYNEGKNDREIAEEVGCWKRTICNWRAANGLKTNGNRGRKPKQKETVIRRESRG